MRKTFRRISKKMSAVILTGVLTIASMTSVFATYATKEFKSSGGKKLEVKASTSTIGQNKYAFTAIMESENKDIFDSMYIDAELFCSGIENPFDDKTVYNKNVVTVTVNNAAGGISYGKGVTNTNVGDKIYGYGGTTLYN